MGSCQLGEKESEKMCMGGGGKDPFPFPFLFKFWRGHSCPDGFLKKSERAANGRLLQCSYYNTNPLPFELPY